MGPEIDTTAHHRLLFDAKTGMRSSVCFLPQAASSLGVTNGKACRKKPSHKYFKFGNEEEIGKTMSRAKSAKDAKKKQNKGNGGGAFANLACLARGIFLKSFCQPI